MQQRRAHGSTFSHYNIATQIIFIIYAAISPKRFSVRHIINTRAKYKKHPKKIAKITIELQAYSAPNVNTLPG